MADAPMMIDRPSPADGPVARHVRLLIRATVGLYVAFALAVAGGGAYLWHDQRANRALIGQNRALLDQQRRIVREEAQLVERGLEAHAAICLLRGELRRSVAVARRSLGESESFLRTHLDGFAGISRAVIVAGVARQRHDLVLQQGSLAALSVARC